MNRLRLCCHTLALACLSFVATTANATPTDTECLLDWAETRVPTLLAPAHQVTQTLTPFSFRYYPATGAYFGLIGTSVFAYYQNQLTNVGAVSSLLATARAENCGVPVTPPAPTDPLVARSGTYTCTNLNRESRMVTLNLTSSRAVVNIASLYDIPFNTFDLPYSSTDSDLPKRTYVTNSLPLKMVTFDPTSGSAYPLAIVYTASAYSGYSVWVCR